MMKIVLFAEEVWRMIAQNGWPNLQKLAREWSLIILKSGDEYYEFTQVFKKIEGKENAFGKKHRKNKCRVNFSKKTNFIR